MNITDDLKKLTDDDLASRIVGLNCETQQSLLAKWEWERRKLEQQHKFDRAILSEQVTTKTGLIQRAPNNRLLGTGLRCAPASRRATRWN